MFEYLYARDPILIIRRSESDSSVNRDTNKHLKTLQRIYCEKYDLS